MNGQLIDYVNISKLVDYYIERMIDKTHIDLKEKKKLKVLKKYKLIFPKNMDGFKTQIKEYYSSDRQDIKILSILKFVGKAIRKQYVTECRYDLNNHFIEISGSKSKGNYRIRIRERLSTNTILVTVMTEIRGS